MSTVTEKLVKEGFTYTSNIALDVWTPKQDAKAFEWWYFDALSEDGRDAVVVIFLDNFIFSPRYNSPNRRNPNGAAEAQRIPAIAFIYYRDGKAVYRAVNEFGQADFAAGLETPSCRIGANSFEFKYAPYGSGYFVSIDTKLSRNRHLKAQFEWLSIESNFLPEKQISPHDSHIWNLVAPRSDVTGRITVSNVTGDEKDVIHFRGTGYHDHNSDNRWLPETVSDWQWGRAHFADSTAVFYRYKEFGQKEPVTKLFTIMEGEFHVRDSQYEEAIFKRDKFGIKYPSRQSFVLQNNTRLRVKQKQIIDSSFFYLRFLSEMTLTIRDGKPRKTLGITEYLAPKALKYGWLDWLVNMRIGRHGKGSFLS